MLPSTDSTTARTGDRPRRRASALAAALLAGALALSACGDAGADTSAKDEADWPRTVENCGAQVTFEKVPERVVLLKSASVPFLSELGMLDKVVARAGVYPREYYDDETWAALEKIPVLTDQVDPSGHLLISREMVLAQKADLVIGEIDNLKRATLAASDIPLLEEPALCETGLEDPGFDDISAQMSLYGTVFDRVDAAEQANAALEKRVEEITSRVTGDKRTAAVLYPTIGGGVTYAYGNQSMASPQLEAAGLTDVFADTDDRVFEVTREELIGRNPDVLILLYSEGDPEAVKAAVTSIAGANQINAVRTDTIIVQQLNFTEPPTPLAVDGLDRIVTRLYGP